MSIMFSEAIHYIWQYFDSHPGTTLLDVEDIQELPDMYFRKKYIKSALLWPSNPRVIDMSRYHFQEYPTEDQCVQHVLNWLVEKFKVYDSIITADYLQDCFTTPFRKQILRKAIDIFNKNAPQKPLVNIPITINPDISECSCDNCVNLYHILGKKNVYKHYHIPILRKIARFRKWI